MRISAPEWLVMIPVFMVLGWYVRGLQLWRPLRVACLALLVCALVGPERQTLRPGVDLLVLVDQSDSASELIQPKLEEWQSILEESQGADDQLRLIDFAETAVQRVGGETAVYTGGRALTRTDTALRTVLARQDPDRATRVLLLTDGYSTAPIEPLTEALQQAGVALYYRTVNEAAHQDVRVARFEMPQRSQPGAPFLIEFQVVGTAQASASYQLYRNDELVREGTVDLQNGQGWMRLTDRLTEAGAFKYTVRVQAEGDTKTGNNVAERWIELDAGGRILLLSAYTDDPLFDILRAQGFNVTLITDYGVLHRGMLAGAKAVLINNVPAHVIPDDFLKELHTYVTIQGGGLAMLGGKYSFGSGGYYQSPLDAVLPVSMELREDQKRLATSMIIVMDRSGSMTATVSGTQTKMDLANAGAAGTVGLLGPMDSIGVFAVDSLAHEVVPMTMIGNRQELLRNQILHIESTGGGIFVYTGLKAAWDRLENVYLGQKHVILFSDVADSEEPGDYKKLLATMREAGATVSVIGLGSEQDSDAEFLKDIALRGGGRIFFNSNPSDLPRVFAQETVAVARSSFIEEATAVVGTDGWLQLAAKPLRWLPEVEGYNLSYLKKDAVAVAVTGDEYKAPLLAFKRFGAGRSAAITFAIGGEFSGLSRQWSELPDLTQSLTRWLVGDGVPEGLGVNVRTDGSLLKLDLLYDERHDQLVANHPPKILMTDSGSTTAQELVWRRIQPGQLSVETQLDFGTVYKGAVQLGDMTIPFGPISTNQNVEWQQAPERLRELAAVSVSTGGRSLTQLEDVWESVPSARYASMRHWILILLLSLCLIEFLRTRLG